MNLYQRIASYAALIGLGSLGLFGCDKSDTQTNQAKPGVIGGGGHVRLLEEDILIPVCLPQNVAGLYNRANKAFDAGDYLSALELYNKAYSVLGMPEPNLLNDKGVALKCLGRLEEAIKCYDAAIKSDSNNHYSFRPWDNKGVALALLGKFKEAMECHKKALEINPNYEIAKSNLKTTEIRRNLTSDERISDAEGEYVKELVLNAAKTIGLDWKETEIEFLTPRAFREKYRALYTGDVLFYNRKSVVLIKEFVLNGRTVYLNALDRFSTITCLCHALGHQVAVKKNIPDGYVRETVAYYVEGRLTNEIIVNGKFSIEDAGALAELSIDNPDLDSHSKLHAFAIRASSDIKQYSSTFEEGLMKLVECKRRDNIKGLIKKLKNRNKTKQ